MFYLKTKRRDYILLIGLEKNVYDHICLFGTVFLGALSDYFTSVVECRSYLHLFTKLPVTSTVQLCLQKLGLVPFCPLYSSSPWWIWIYSTTVSCPKWHLTGPGSQLLAGWVPRTAIVRTVNAGRVFKHNMLPEMLTLQDRSGFLCGQPKCIWTFCRTLS